MRDKLPDKCEYPGCHEYKKYECSNFGCMGVMCPKHAYHSPSNLKPYCYEHKPNISISFYKHSKKSMKNKGR